jgi:hypothetical protein
VIVDHSLTVMHRRVKVVRVQPENENRAGNIKATVTFSDNTYSEFLFSNNVGIYEVIDVIVKMSWIWDAGVGWTVRSLNGECFRNGQRELRRSTPDVDLPGLCGEDLWDVLLDGVPMQSTVKFQLTE